MNQEKLIMSTFKFSNEDLQANRNGVFSEKQKNSYRINAKIGLVAFTTIGFIFTIMFVLSWKKPLNEIPLIIPGFFIIAFTSIGIFLFWLLSKSYKSGIVKCATGKITFYSFRGNLFLSIGNEGFPLLANINGMFEVDATYKVYYTPFNRSILSIEKV